MYSTAQYSTTQAILYSVRQAITSGLIFQRFTSAFEDMLFYPRANAYNAHKEDLTYIMHTAQSLIWLESGLWQELQSVLKLVFITPHL